MTLQEEISEANVKKSYYHENKYIIIIIEHEIKALIKTKLI